MPPTFTTNTAITTLVNEAIRAATVSMSGAEPTSENLTILATRIRARVIGQAIDGQWATLGFPTLADIEPLGVTATLGDPELGEPPISIAFNFKGTKRPDLIVEMGAPSADIPEPGERPKVKVSITRGDES